MLLMASHRDMIPDRATIINHADSTQIQLENGVRRGTSQSSLAVSGRSSQDQRPADIRTTGSVRRLQVQ
jgi:hypothetical protein